ncbi:urease accessory protein UreF [Peteryoungia desertarenae]|nr:urease accessory protein UreF [Peteryoungia desertarenae]
MGNEARGRDANRLSMMRLSAWLSPAFPVGGFAYSGGLETAIASELIKDEEGLYGWLRLLLTDGGLRNDAILFLEGHRRHGDEAALAELADLSVALAGSAERHQEVTRLGQSFLQAARSWPHPVLDMLERPVAYSVAVGAVSAAHGIASGDALSVFLPAQLSQLISVAVRLGVIGQRQAVELTARFEGDLLREVEALLHLTLDDLGSASITAETLSMRHETQYSRLFQS